MRYFFAALMVIVLAGCATGKDPALMQYDGLGFVKTPSGQEYITTANFTYPDEQPKSSDALPLCLARVVNAYPSTAQPVRFMAEDKRRAVADGGVKLYKSALGSSTETLVRYSLDVLIKQNERVYAFDKLDQMLMSSPTLGFIRIGAWAGGSGIEAVEALRGVAESINTCLSQ